HIADILAVIEVVIDNGFASEVAGVAYYRTRKIPIDGKSGHQLIEALEEGASKRIGVEQQLKEDPVDFALWKSGKEDESSWDSP
ncbi:cysteine--tRNA ligase, partial [Enterococcus faecalis]|nr:cysteine--tRNA ligase [Enterococcus faecalis]